VSDAGSNSYGINTGVRTSGHTFGVQAFTTGLGGELSAPAALYGENTGTTDGDILRLYSSTVTSAPYLAQIYQEISNYSGTALFMDIGANGGTFSGNFVDFQNNDVTKFMITNAGKVGIGTSTLATTSLTVAGDIRVGTSGTNGCLQGFGGATLTGTCTSDERLKGNVMDITNVLEKIKNVKVVNFKWNQTAHAVYGNDMTSIQTGYLAQNVESLFPELVTTNNEGFKEVNYSALGLYAMEGVKELAIKESDTTETLNKFVTAISVDDAPTSSSTIVINARGFVGVGSAHPLTLLHVHDKYATGTVARFENVSGYCDIDPNTKSLVCTTDDTNRIDMMLIDSTTTVSTSSPYMSTTTVPTSSTTLERLTSLHVVTYKIGESDNERKTGLLTAEVESLFPGLVTLNNDGTKSLSLTNLIPFIIESIKSLAVQIEEMRNMFVTKEICIGTTESKTCLTKEKVDQLLLLQSTTNASALTATSTATTTEVSTEADTGTSTVVIPIIEAPEVTATGTVIIQEDNTTPTQESSSSTSVVIPDSVTVSTQPATSSPLSIPSVVVEQSIDTSEPAVVTP
jgi:hypothetical protein